MKEGGLQRSEGGRVAKKWEGGLQRSEGGRDGRKVVRKGKGSGVGEREA